MYGIDKIVEREIYLQGADGKTYKIYIDLGGILKLEVIA